MKNTLLYLMCLFLLLAISNCQNEPLEGEFDTEAQLDCNETSEALEVASSNFETAEDEVYTQFCNLYKFALLNQIAACGDLDGSLLTIFEDLEDCELIVQLNSCQTAIDAVNLAQLNFDNTSDADYEMFCNAYKTALEVQIAVCGDVSGDIQAIIDGLGDCTN